MVTSGQHGTEPGTSGNLELVCNEAVLSRGSPHQGKPFLAPNIVPHLIQAVRLQNVVDGVLKRMVIPLSARIRLPLFVTI